MPLGSTGIGVRGIAQGYITVISVAFATETDSAFTVRRDPVPIGIASETDTSLSITRIKIASLGLASETDSAFNITIPITVNVGLVSEADSALSIIATFPVKSVSVALTAGSANITIDSPTATTIVN